MVLPWIAFLPKALGGAFPEMSDIEFLSIKEFQGKLRKNESQRTTTGTLATLTAGAAPNKDMYIARAQVTFVMDTINTSSFLDKVELQIDGVPVETAIVTLAMLNTNAGFLMHTYNFEDIGHKVTTGKAIRLQVITLSANVTVEGFVECFEEDTGKTPQIAPLNPV